MDERLISGGVVDLGLFTRPEVLAAGYDDNHITRMVRSGAWHRVRNGAFITSSTWERLDEVDRHRVRSRAVLRKARCEGVLSHVSALAEYGVPFWDLSLEDVHLTRFDQRAGSTGAPSACAIGLRVDWGGSAGAGRALRCTRSKRIWRSFARRSPCGPTRPGWRLHRGPRRRWNSSARRASTLRTSIRAVPMSSFNSARRGRRERGARNGSALLLRLFVTPMMRR